MALKLQHQLPEFYRALLPREILSAEVRETKATCDSCAMTREKRGARARVTYQGHLKCCTYEPFLPNFLVGAVLSHADRFPVGVAAMRAKIEKREFALPIGLVPRLSLQVEFNNRRSGEFGQREDWLCPYYQKDSNNCGIWKYRGSVCTAFFCQSDFGAKGLRFWSRFSNYLGYVEMALAEEALVELDFSPRQISSQLEYLNRKDASASERLDSLSAKDWRQIWNGYDSGVEEFYKKCYEKVKSWDRARFEEALGETGAQQERRVKAQLLRLQKGSAG
jgi:hypothetical protein